MQFTVFGAGLMGRYIVNDLTTHLDAQVTWIDRSKAALEAGRASLMNDAKIQLVEASITPESDFAPYIQPGSVVIGASSYEHHYQLTQAALKQRAHWLDLGGNNTVVAKQRALDERAKRMDWLQSQTVGWHQVWFQSWVGSFINVLNTLTPSVFALEDFLQSQRMSWATSLFSPRVACSTNTVSLALSCATAVFVEVAPMTELETLSLGQRFPELEAFTTSGGISTLAESLMGRIEHADYKTIRYPGHARIISTMMSLGFFSDQAVAQSGETAFDVSAGILEKSLYSDAPDVVLVKAEARQGSTSLGAWTCIIDADET